MCHSLGSPLKEQRDRCRASVYGVHQNLGEIEERVMGVELRSERDRRNRRTSRTQRWRRWLRRLLSSGLRLHLSARAAGRRAFSRESS